MKRDSALLWRQEAKAGRPGAYIGVLKLSHAMAKIAAGQGIWITVTKHTGTAPVLEVSVAPKWSERAP
jgi:hypothetical protein